MNPRFLFTAKLWEGFTHTTGATAGDERAVRAGFDVLRDAGKLGAVLLQFPFSFHRTPENVALFKNTDCAIQGLSARRGSPARDHGTIRRSTKTLKERGVGFCNIDQPVIGRSLKPSDVITAPIGYVRLHGRRYDTWFSDDPGIPSHERYNYLYSEKELEPWAERISKVASKARARSLSPTIITRGRES